MRPYRFRNTPKEKEYEYYVQDSNAELNEAKKYYNEIDKEHLGIKSKYNNFFNCLVEEMRNRKLLVPAVKKFYDNCFKYNPNYGKKRAISFYRPVKHKELNTLYQVWLRKNKDFKWQGSFKTLNNSEIARQVGYGGFRQVQLAYVSAKNLIVNLSKGIFPKNTL